jgi:citrate synthase
MAMLCGMVGSLASVLPRHLDLEDPEQRRLAAIRLIAKVPTIAAACLSLFDRLADPLPAQQPRLRDASCT